jgi:hypothetical protein
MPLRTLEDRLDTFTLVALVIFAPLETGVSMLWGGGLPGLLSPFYLVDFIGMALMALGIVVSRRARPRCAPGVLCAAYGWMGANGWRATFGRALEMSRGGNLHYGAPELWVVGTLTALSLLALAVSVYLAAAAHHSGITQETPGGSSPA